MNKQQSNVITTAASRKIRLATADLPRLIAKIEKVTKTTVPEAIQKDRKKIVKWAKENGWGYKGNVVNQAKKDEYGPAQTCGDKMAETLARFVRTVTDTADFCDIKKLHEVAKANGLSLDRWLHCNIGQIRMNLSNVLRGAVRQGRKVTVGDQVWNKNGDKIVQKVAKAKGKKVAAKAKKTKAPKEAKVEIQATPVEVAA